jgi:hypothetical protein
MKPSSAEDRCDTPFRNPLEASILRDVNAAAAVQVQRSVTHMDVSSWITIALVAWVFCYGGFVAMLLRSAAATTTMRDRADENRDR